MKRRTPDERAAFDRCHRRPRCQANLPECTGRNDHAHHRQFESQGGPTIDDNLLAVCHRCHWRIHNLMPRTEAVNRGLIIPSWADITPFTSDTPTPAPATR